MSGTNSREQGAPLLALQIGVDRGLSAVNQSVAGGSGAGTLTNAPHAGPPDGYLPLVVNGVNVRIPFWNG